MLLVHSVDFMHPPERGAEVGVGTVCEGTKVSDGNVMGDYCKVLVSHQLLVSQCQNVGRWRVHTSQTLLE